MKTYTGKKSDFKEKWYIIDASTQTLGRLASEVARRLIGKHKPEYTPNLLSGDLIIVVNAENLKVTGNKMEDKMYRRHSNYLGGLKEISLKEQMEKDPCLVIKHAVSGMLPKNKLREPMLKHLKVYAGEEHPHSAQNPELIKL